MWAPIACPIFKIYKWKSSNSIENRVHRTVRFVRISPLSTWLDQNVIDHDIGRLRDRQTNCGTTVSKSGRIRRKACRSELLEQEESNWSWHGKLLGGHFNTPVAAITMKANQVGTTNSRRYYYPQPQRNDSKTETTISNKHTADTVVQLTTNQMSRSSMAIAFTASGHLAL